jgi:hypothetical protein
MMETVTECHAATNRALTDKSMTIEERFEKIEHVTAGIAEERRKDREEYRQLWRETRREMHEVALKMNDLTLKIADTNDTVARLAEESRAADKRLGERIESLVSAIGQYLAKQP